MGSLKPQQSGETSAGGIGRGARGGINQLEGPLQPWGPLNPCLLDTWELEREFQCNEGLQDSSLRGWKSLAFSGLQNERSGKHGRQDPLSRLPGLAPNAITSQAAPGCAGCPQLPGGPGSHPGAEGALVAHPSGWQDLCVWL